MLFTSEYSMKMPLFEALMTSLVGIVTVICILAIIAVLIILVSKVIRTVENAASKKKAAPAAVSAPSAPAGKPTGVIPVAGVSQGTIDLVNVDEKTAAIIMAIVSDKSGIPLNRLSFKSIKLVEDENK